MPDEPYSKPSPALSSRRRKLAPDIDEAFHAFGRAVFADGALTAKDKHIIAVAVAHVTQCPWCIKGHVTAARRHGASPDAIMEAIWVASEMRAGAAFAHSQIAVSLFEDPPAENDL